MSKNERLIDLQQRLSGNYPATILLFKAGAFAQAFNEDALLLHKELGFKLAIELTLVANRYPMATNEGKISALREMIWITNAITDFLNISKHVSSLSNFEQGAHCVKHAEKMNAIFTTQLASLHLA